ncbi:MAG: N-acetylmuramoyl-L-alanine amidase [Firmicutes bacterium]|nr:N-acetylmuramoyl-L-alanine amidase [Bacillota bacterium]
MNKKSIIALMMFMIIGIAVITVIAIPSFSNGKKAEAIISNEEVLASEVQAVEEDMGEEKESLKEAEKEEVIEVEEEIVKYKICIDPGHQLKGNSDHEPIGPGSDKTKPKVSSGTRGVATKIPEYQINLEVSLKLRDALIEKGYDVVLTRDKNEVDLSNRQRASIATESNSDIFLRIHADGAGKESVNGIHVLCPGETDKFTVDIYEESNILSRTILEKLVQSTGARNRGISYRDDISGFNWSTVPVALIEMGFMTNKREDKLLSTEEYQYKIVEGIVEGIDAYFTE